MKNILTNQQEKLILENQKLITYVIESMNLIKDYDEYYDIATIGLVKAAKYYDLNKKFKFSTYAIKSIRNEILTHIRKEKTDKRKANYNTVSLDAEIESCENEKTITLHNKLQSKVNIEQELERKEKSIELLNIIDKLSEKEKLVIYYTYGLNSYPILKQCQISEFLNTSQGNVSRLRIKGIKKLRDMLKGRDRVC